MMSSLIGSKSNHRHLSRHWPVLSVPKLMIVRNGSIVILSTFLRFINFCEVLFLFESEPGHEGCRTRSEDTPRYSASRTERSSDLVHWCLRRTAALRTPMSGGASNAL